MGGGNVFPAVGSVSTVTPSKVEVTLVLEKVVVSVVDIAAAVIPKGTAITASMTTLPAFTVTVTASVGTPAAAAIFVRKLSRTLGV